MTGLRFCCIRRKMSSRTLRQSRYTSDNVEYIKKVFTYDRNLVVQRKTNWSRSTPTQCSGDHIMNASVKAAVLLGKDDEEKLRVTKSTEFSEILAFDLHQPEIDP